MAYTVLIPFTGHLSEGPAIQYAPGDTISEADAKTLGLAGKPDLATKDKKGAAVETGNS